MYKEIISKIISAVVDQPLLGSIFIADFAVLAFHKPPFIFSVVMLGGLGAICMYFGQKLALFNLSSVEPAAEQTEKAE